MSKQRDNEIMRYAYLMADSGNHSGWQQIEWALRGEGYARARHLLDGEYIRNELDQRCATARAAFPHA
jgi:hypothetical protein